MRRSRRNGPETLARRLKPEEVLRLLAELRRLDARGRSGGSRLISMKVPETLLAAFKTKARLKGTRYQTQIKELMRRWLAGGG